MQVTSIKISNFGRFSGTHEFAFGPRTYILGENEAGKSTLQDAVRWVLTGWCRGLTAAGRGVQDLRSVGVKDAAVTVSAVVQVGGKVWSILREWDESGPHFQVDGLSGSSSDQQRAWLEIIGNGSADLYRMAFDGELFYAAGEVDVKNLLMSVLPVRLSAPGPDGSEPQAITLEQVDQRYTEAFALRRELKAALKLVPPMKAPAEAVGDIDGVRTRLEALRQEREKLAAEGASSGAEDRVALASLERELVAAGVEGTETVALTDEILAATSVDPVLGSDVVAANGALTRLQDARAALVAKGPDAVDVAALLAHKPSEGCVLHPEVPCLTKAKQFKDVAKSLQGAYDAAVAGHEKALADIDANIKTAETALDEAKGLLAQAQEVVRVYSNARQIRALARSVAELRAKVEQSAPVSPEIATLDERIAKGQGILEQKIRLQEQHRQFVETVARRAQLTKDLAQAEKDVEVYGPHGIRVKALAESIDTFVSAVNAALDPFGYVLSLSVEPWELRVNGVILDRWSLSQRLRISVAIQCALAQVAGLSMTLVDQVDLLLNEPRKKLGQLIMTLPLDQIIVARAFEASSAVPVTEGVTIIRL